MKTIFFKVRGSASSKTSSRGGFTLIELMVVIAIIGILASIITVSLVSAQAKGRDAKRISDVKNIQLALEEYFNDNGFYPVNLSSPTPPLVPNYLPSMPLDPKDNSTQYKYTTWNAGGNQVCTGSNMPIGYHLGAGLEDTTNTALQQDRDLAVRVSTTDCNGTADFDGKAATVSNACGSSASVTEACYDVSN